MAVPADDHRYSTDPRTVSLKPISIPARSEWHYHIGTILRKTKILSTGGLLGGIAGSAIGYFSPTAVHFPAIIAIYAALFCMLGVGVSAVAWMFTRTSEEREDGKRREEQFQEQTRQAARGGASILGGVAMMIAATAWFVIGLTADTIFFYPPVLFVIGLFAFIRGILSGGTKIVAETETEQAGG